MRQGDNVFRYDANGRMVEKTLKRDGFRAQTSFYHWDEEDRLIRVSLPNGDIWHYEYDVFGRRCRKYRQQPATQPTSAQSLTQQISQGDIRYQWLGDQLSQQQSYYADGSVATTQWLYEPGSFRPLAQIRQLDTPDDPGRPELHYAVTDLAGNVRELCDPQGQIHWRGEQGLWQDFHQWRLSGTPKKYLEQAANEPLHCDLRYQGQIYDRETGLYYNRHRYYDPEICQYLSPDPIGLAGGTRPQAYVHNPLEWVDPLGLAGCELAKPGEDLYVGTYNQVRGANIKSGLNPTHTPHHAIQNAVSPTTHGRGITINMRKELHELTWTYKKPLVKGLTDREYLARDIVDLRKILGNAGYDRRVINRQLSELIKQNKELWKTVGQ
ncbi:RHS repeat domain-containing protein [Shewanella chilikensis]|uniref:RHS repeat domain-containing protein n=1 Tax=Shewanella chilikensis TaxID=558541 RepID=UPI003999E48F